LIEELVYCQGDQIYYSTARACTWASEVGYGGLFKPRKTKTSKIFGKNSKQKKNKKKI